LQEELPPQIMRYAMNDTQIIGVQPGRITPIIMPMFLSICGLNPKLTITCRCYYVPLNQTQTLQTCYCMKPRPRRTSYYINPGLETFATESEASYGDKESSRTSRRVTTVMKKCAIYFNRARPNTLTTGTYGTKLKANTDMNYYLNVINPTKFRLQVQCGHDKNHYYESQDAKSMVCHR
jgi:hypothetical protein